MSLEAVREFHTVFRSPVKNDPDLTDETINKLRIKLLREELDELEEALEAKDPVEVLDALTDLQYVLDGAYLSLGYWRFKDAAMNEVHTSNMSKLDESGQPLFREDGKILKGPNFKEPDLMRVIMEGWYK